MGRQLLEDVAEEMSLGSVVGLKAAGLAVSTYGLGMWFGLGAFAEFAVMQDLRADHLLAPPEEVTLKIAIGMAGVVMGLLWSAGLKTFHALKGYALVLAVFATLALLFVEIGSVCMAPQFEMSAGSFRALVAVLIVHTLSAFAILAHYVATNSIFTIEDK